MTRSCTLLCAFSCRNDQWAQRDSCSRRSNRILVSTRSIGGVGRRIDVHLDLVVLASEELHRSGSAAELVVGRPHEAIESIRLAACGTGFPRTLYHNLPALIDLEGHLVAGL